MATVGLLANPNAGKDIRRLVAHASPMSDGAKLDVLRRAAIGAIEGGATRLVVADDLHSIGRRAVAGLDGGCVIEFLAGLGNGRGSDSTDLTERMQTAGVDVMIVLGGDGTCRDVAKGWLTVPLVALSSGTNNVFPRTGEGTTAGLAAGLVACERVPLDEATSPAKVLHLTFSDGRPDDIALVEVAVVRGTFLGAGAVWDADTLIALVAAIAEPDAVGLSSVAAMLHPLSRFEPGGVVVHCGPGPTVRAALGAGTFASVPHTAYEVVAEERTVVFVGPGTLSLDGERLHVLSAATSVTVVIRCDGPRVIDVRATLLAAHSADPATAAAVGDLEPLERSHVN
jgi:ATP-NAD kinase N-terminal domain